MSFLDYVLIAVVVVSSAWGVWRGLAREVLSLAGWVIAFVAANLFAAPLAEALPRSIERPELRMIVAFVAVFLVALTVTTLAAVLLSKLLKAVGLGGLDRTLGGLFGLARALVLALAFALVAGLTSLSRHPLWMDSFSGPALGRAVLELRPWLPAALARRLRYH